MIWSSFFALDATTGPQEITTASRSPNLESSNEAAVTPSQAEIPSDRINSTEDASKDSDSLVGNAQDKIDSTIESIIESIASESNTDSSNNDNNSEGIIKEKLGDLLTEIKEGYDSLVEQLNSSMAANPAEETGKDGAIIKGEANSNSILDLYKNATEMNVSIDYPLNKAYVFKCKMSVDEDQILLIKINGSANITLVIIDEKTSKVREAEETTIDGERYINYVVLTPGYCRKGQDFLIFSKENNKETTIIAYYSDGIPVDFNDTIKVFSLFTDRTKILVKNNFAMLQANPENRLQLMVQTEIQEKEIKEGQQIYMLINKNGVFPTPDNHQMKATGSIGDGLMKTFSQKTNDACKTKTCNYQVSIYAKNIKEFIFFPVLFANDSEIRVEDDITVIEELENGEIVTYKIVIEMKDNFAVFEVIPTQADISFYVNPNSKPKELSDYAYSATDRGIKKIVISDSDIGKTKSRNKVFYVTFSSRNPGRTATFKFSVEKHQNDDIIDMDEENLYYGHMAKNEIKQAYLDLLSDKNEKYSLEFELNAGASMLSLLIKECKTDDEVCQIEPQDVFSLTDPSKNTLYNDRIFRTVTIQEKNMNQYKATVLLDFECLGKDRIHTKQLAPVSAQSKSCKFVVGITSSRVATDVIVPYKLEVRGQNKFKTIYTRKSITLTLNSYDTKNFVISIDKVDFENFKYMSLKIISLTGSCKVYLSKTNENPTENDFDAFISINDDTNTSLDTGVYGTMLNLQHLNSNREVYMSMVGIEYSILQIYIDFINSDADSNLNVHHIHEDELVHGKIGENNLKDFQNTKIYSQEFLFEAPPFLDVPDYIEVSVNSNHLGLVICIQINVEEFDPTKICDYLSDNETITVPNFVNLLDDKKLLLISIQKREEINTNPVKLPIGFSILLTSGVSEGHNIKMLSFGQPHAKLLKAGKTTSYRVNTNHIQNKGLILFSCDHPEVRAKLFIDSETMSEPIAILDQHKFALRINDMGAFKQKFAVDIEADILIQIANTSDHDYRFSVTFSVDDKPIILKEGTHISIPADINQYFIYEASVDYSLNFVAYARSTSGISYAKILDEEELRSHSIPSLLDGSHFDYKSDLNNNMQITIKPSSLTKYNRPFVGFLYSPKMSIKLQNRVIETFDTENKAKIGLHSRIKQLKGYEQTDGKVSEGEFDYFYFVVDEPQEFSIILTVETGEADLYLNQGMFNFTTLNHYWKKRATYKGDEIMIKKSMFKNEGDIVGTYTIGIYGQKTSNFSILYLPEFANLIRIHYQHLVNIILKPDTFYYFDFYNKYEAFSTYFYSRDADVELSLLNFDEKDGQELIDVIRDEESYTYSRVFHKFDPPILNLSENQTDIKSRYIIRARASKNKSEFTLAIFDEKSPLIASPLKRFYFVQDKDKKQVFKVVLNQEIEEVDVSVKMSFGKLTLKLSDYINFEDPPVSFTSPEIKEMSFKVVSPNQPTDIMLFKELYILVESQEFTSYSILVKPKNSYVELKFQESDLIKTSSERDVFAYFTVTKSDLHRILSISMQLKTIQSVDGKPELLFMPDSDLTLSEDSNYLPMPLLDYLENVKQGFIDYEISPDVLSGIYIVKFPKTHSSSLVKISLSYNNHRNLELNGYSHANSLTQTNDHHSYSLFIPESGDVRLILDTCTEAKIENIKFNNSTNFLAQDNFYQTQNLIVAQPFHGLLRKQNVKVKQNLKRVVIKEKGLLTFEVKLSDKSLIDVEKMFKDYYIISEFKAKEETLILKDYIDVFSDANDFRKLLLKHNFVDHQHRLVLATHLPKIKDQLYQDFPKFRKVEFKVHYFLHTDLEFVKKFEICGLDAIRHVTHFAYSLTKQFPLPMPKDANQTIELIVEGVDLDNVKDSSTIGIFAYVAVYFYENDGDEFGMSLDPKFAVLPFMQATIPNSYEDLSSIYMLFFMIFIAALSLIILIIFCIHTVSARREAYRYSPAHNISRIEDQSNRLEMSTISNT